MHSALPRSESEDRTRHVRINPLLKSQRWNIVPYDPAASPVSYTADAITEYATVNGPADYALFVAGQPLGIVEAKKITLGPQNVLTQAERYSRGVANSPFDFSGFRVPFLYSTNGEIVWFHDIRHELNRSRRIATFHTPSALQEMLTRDFDAACSWFAATPNRHTLLRPYQIEANTAIERAITGRILWEQMLGRGTRRCADINKSHFTVFDCFDGSLLEYFRKVSAFTVEPPDKPARTVQEIIEAIWQNRDRPYNIRCLVKRLQRIDKEMSGEARDRFAQFIPDGDVARFANTLPGKLASDFTAGMQLLRDPAFQDLLVNYPRPPKTFVVAYPTEDTVSSAWLIKGADGKEYKPEDYLTAFARFVQENPLPIEAVRILLNRPQDWSTDALSEVKQKLALAPERFTLDNLEKAHAAHYHKNLVDIISMVKHAARKDEPLLTAPERVESAFAKITAGRSFTPEQQKWLDRIRAHLVVSLTIDREDFDNVPVLLAPDGWRLADRCFGGKLEELLHQINEALAA